ncbi:MAG: MCE family protein [Chitinispirillaceae bacterium]|nr:MCE family protein [Chitinispirillaceae bacterium]
MKKTDVDLVVGASILLAIIILIAGVLWLKEVSVTRKMVDYGVLFPNVGTLQVGDPVMVNGVSKGTVKSIALRDTNVAVILELEKNLKITDSCRIMIQNIGLMGERGIGLQYSQAGSVVKPIQTGDTLFLHGKFDTGIAEAIGMLGNVLGEVQTLATNLASIVGQTVGDSSFIELFKTIVARLDTITAGVQTIISENGPAIDESIGNLRQLSEQASQLVQRNAPLIDSIVVDGEALSSRAVLIAGNVDTITQSVQEILDRLEDEESTIGRILRDKEMYDDLKTTIADLDTLVKNVQQDALKLRIKFGFGKKKK